MCVRDTIKDYAKALKTVKALRYIFKGDIGIVKAFFVQKFVSAQFYGVNKLLTTLDTFKD